MDKRVFVLGAIMLAVGFSVYGYLNENAPTGKTDMSQDEIDALNQAEIVNAGLGNIAAMIGGIGFFIVLISIGLKRRKKDGAGKPVTQKPTEI